jgi:CheY-like chemotaxis protein
MFGMGHDGFCYVGRGRRFGSAARKTEDAVPKPWNILVVDDDADVFGITALALKRKKWKDRAFALTSATSAKEAREILLSPASPRFQVAIVDVVMETDDAGLKLCQFIRANCPPTLRIILRTGQPGKAPEDAILNAYDIDHYLAKSEVTEGRLYAAARACLRGAQDIGSVLGMATQLRTLTATLRDSETTMVSLVETMRRTLGFLEDKYDAKLTFVPDIADELRQLQASVQGGGNEAEARYAGAVEALRRAADAKVAPMTLHSAAPFGLPNAHLVVLPSSLDGTPDPSSSPEEGGGAISRWFEKIFRKPRGPQEASGIIVAPEGASLASPEDFLMDLEFFMTNWLLVRDVLLLRGGGELDRSPGMFGV